MKKLVCSILLCLALPSTARAETAASPEVLAKLDRLHVSYRINEDGSSVQSRDWAMTVLKEKALESTKSTSITYSSSVEKAEVLEAYTRKADGRRIDAPPTNFQVEVNSGQGQNAPVFSDYSTLTVVFPDVAVGDTVVLSYRLTQTEPIFPGQFSVAESFPKAFVYEDVSIRIDAPASLWTQQEARELTEVENREQGDRKIVAWTYRHPQPVKDKSSEYAIYNAEKEPGYAYSTFHNYAEIAAAYGARARPKAAVTERVRQLAKDIVGQEGAPRERARRLYEWVATNITYAGNCVGVGAVVPHDLDFVLDNRMGDCKDHATLLQALLAAQGIESTQALINAGSMYRLPKVPVVHNVNHVINYLPGLGLFADSTSDSTPFGMLPFGSADKPVLLVDGFREGLRSSRAPHDANRQTMKTQVTIKPDGSATGKVDVSLQGMYAVNSRARFRQLSRDDEEELVEKIFNSNGRVGAGTLTKEDPADLRDHYQYGVSYELREFLPLPGAGALNITPLFYSEAPINRYLLPAIVPEVTEDTSCAGGHSVEEYVFELPKTLTVLAIPANVTVNDEFLRYRATYRRKGNTIHVKRELDDQTPGNVCSPAVSRAYKRFASRVMQDVRAQIVYR